MDFVTNAIVALDKKSFKCAFEYCGVSNEGMIIPEDKLNQSLQNVLKLAYVENENDEVLEDEESDNVSSPTEDGESESEFNDEEEGDNSSKC